MTMGEYIRKLRKEKGWTQEELGQKLDPPVNKPAINKWETGRVENIKRSHIQQMSELFDVRPAELMCFDYSNDYGELNDEELKKAFSIIHRKIGARGAMLLEYYRRLNDTGKEKLINDLEDLSSLPKYTD